MRSQRPGTSGLSLPALPRAGGLRARPPMRALPPMLAPLTLALTLALLSSGCAREELSLGGSCTLNTDCPAPLACRLDRCRRQCVDSRDCGAGLACLLLDATVGGFCQLPEESLCALSSECPEQLVCRFQTCTTPCAEDRDCVEGARCLDSPEGLACSEPLAELCVYHSDCPDPLVCWSDQICRFECLDDRDCASGELCSSDQSCLPAP
ncbi:MAG: hypothetical protein OEY14_19055 [Myxococcales bacterium]|nr:hypothetical protein [Myxococcales bacterium]